MRIEKKFLVPKWDESLKQKAISFWSKRDIVFEKSEVDFRGIQLI